jgi:hypothetical protein
VVFIGHDLPILGIAQWSEPITELMATAAKQLPGTRQAKSIDTHHQRCEQGDGGGVGRGK